jgi:hypothetical protein
MKMSIENLPYVDLGCSADTLRKYCQDHFGKKISTNAKDETVVERFAQIYLEETGIALTPVTDSKDDDEEKTARQPTHATIVVQDDERDPSPVCGSVNFVAYRIPRNKEVKVPYKIVESLRHASKTIYDPDTMEPKQILSYPFSIIENHYEG